MRIAGSKPVAHRAERKERSPKVAVFDYFNEEEGVRHGDRVESILLRSGSLKDRHVQNFMNTYERDEFEEVVGAPSSELLERMETYTEQTVTGFLQATTANMETILENEKNKIRVINQSQSQAPSRVARPFIKKILENEKFRMNVKDALGLNKLARRDTVAEAFLEEVQKTFIESNKIHRAEQSYRKTAKKAFDAGIVHVVTAGNMGAVSAQWAGIGVDVPAQAHKSILANEFTTVVGATDSRGTTTARDDRAAVFTSPDAGAEFAMHGVNVGVPAYRDQSKDYSNGTSYAAPQVTALIHDMVTVNPKLSVTDVEDLLFKSTVPVNASSRQVGAGQIDPERALFLAEQTAYIAKNA